MEHIPNSHHGVVANLGVCAAVFHRLHELEILLGDTNRNNVLVTADGGRAGICDIASSEFNADDAPLKEEEDKLCTSLESDLFDKEDDMWDIYGQHRFTEVSGSEYGI